MTALNKGVAKETKDGFIKLQKKKKITNCDILVSRTVLIFSVTLSPYLSIHLFFCLIHPLGLLGASVYKLTPRSQEPPTPGLKSESSFILNFSKLYHKYLLFLDPIPLQ